jgi:mRNA-degrading endonuclease RelE of RelBE toxin-antitoxin system
MAYDVEFAASVKAQLAVLTASQRATALDAIEKQLVYEPLVETRDYEKHRNLYRFQDAGGVCQ